MSAIHDPVSPAPPQWNAATPESQRKNTAGLISLIVGAVIPVLAMAALLSSAAVIQSGAFEVAGIISGMSDLLAALMGLTAITLGVIGLAKRDARKAAAGAGTALGASALFGVFGNLIYAAFLGAFN